MCSIANISNTFLAEIFRIFVVAPLCKIEYVGRVHLVHPIGLASALKLVAEGGDQALERVPDKEEGDRVFQQAPHLPADSGQPG